MSENQAEAILNMRLGSLKKLDEFQSKTEIKKLHIELNFLNWFEKIMSESLVVFTFPFFVSSGSLHLVSPSMAVSIYMHFFT